MKYLVMLFGANDAVLPLPTTCQHVPMDEYERNLRAMIRHPRIAAHKAKVLLVTPPPVDELKLAKLDVDAGHASATRSFGTSAAYSERARAVARDSMKEGRGGIEEEDVVLIDLWQALMDEAMAMAPQHQQPGGPWLGSPENGKAGGLEQLLPDGLHMGGAGYKVLYELIRPHIGREWTGQETEAGFVLPGWRQVNGAKV
ncbi:hypothetical protein XA68_10180 [Ophiocordyceps unilateralis]|uniref:SGNH hydrolase-type esterase domain-containing protein n=1 Tax=Ophiocordyceps unilateralis TaxID=268505 RepID=A0A2A9PJ01_OPHUN|nr:hypothetical protein XA68_10180 [Ophiocordyceps unilateralis]